NLGHSGDDCLRPMATAIVSLNEGRTEPQLSGGDAPPGAIKTRVERRAVHGSAVADVLRGVGVVACRAGKPRCRCFLCRLDAFLVSSDGHSRVANRPHLGWPIREPKSVHL